MAVDSVARALAAKALSGSGGGGGQGTTVIANPSSQATEILQKLTVGAVTYSVGEYASSLTQIKQNTVSWEAGNTLDSVINQISQLTDTIITVYCSLGIGSSLSLYDTGGTSYNFIYTSFSWQGEGVFGGYVIDSSGEQPSSYIAFLFLNQQKLITTLPEQPEIAINMSTSILNSAGSARIFTMIGAAGTPEDYVLQSEFSPVEQKVNEIDSLLNQPDSSIFMVGE